MKQIRLGAERLFMFSRYEDYPEIYGPLKRIIEGDFWDASNTRIAKTAKEKMRNNEEC